MEQNVIRRPIDAVWATEEKTWCFEALGQTLNELNLCSISHSWRPGYRWHVPENNTMFLR